MNNDRNVLAINGSYREGGTTDQVIASITEELRQQGVAVEEICLRDLPIEFCLNCRACMQEPGDRPGECVIGDAMKGVVDKLEAADGFVLAAPTNFGSATALFKRFQERLAVFGYWPWGAAAPKFRRDKLAKRPALIVSSSAAPGFLGALLYSTPKELRTAARTIGARVVGTVFTGLVSAEQAVTLPARVRKKARRMAARLT